MKRDGLEKIKIEHDDGVNFMTVMHDDPRQDHIKAQTRREIGAHTLRMFTTYGLGLVILLVIALCDVILPGHIALRIMSAVCAAISATCVALCDPGFILAPVRAITRREYPRLNAFSFPLRVALGIFSIIFLVAAIILLVME